MIPSYNPKKFKNSMNRNIRKISALVVFFAFYIMTGIETRTMAMTVELKNYLGSPTIMVDGKPQTPLILWAHASPMGMNQIRLANKAGVHLFSTGVGMPWPKPGEEPDFTQVDKAFDQMIQVDPQILIMPRFHMSPPQWWMDAHPGNEIVFNEGKKLKGKRAFQSIASEVWLKEAIEHMRVFIRHIESKYGDHVIVYHPGCMENGENFYNKAGEKGIFNGFEEVYRTGFAGWVKKKYQNEEQLRKAWGQPEVTFATIRVPTMAERKNAALGIIYDPATQQFQIDFAEYQNIAVSDALMALAHAIKEETQGKKLTMFFYGYYYEIAAMHQFGHLGLGRVLRSPDVDILTSPLSYDNRQPGGTEPMMSPVDAIREAGKLWIVEDDTRTYLSSTHTITTSNPEWIQKPAVMTLRAHQRQFGHLLPRRLGTWYMDLGGEGWLNGEDIWQNIGQIKKIYDREMQIPTPWNPEVAVVADERSSFYTQIPDADLFYPHRSRFLGLPQFYRMGTNFRLLLLNDVLAGRSKLPKVSIFVNCLHMTPADRENLKNKTEGKTAIWFYGSGYVDDNHASALNMADLTGFSFKESLKEEPTEVRFDSGSPLSQGLIRMDYAPPHPDILPRWSIKPNRSIRTIARFTDGSIAAASHATKEKGQSFYIGTLSCPAQVLRNILKEAGVRIYMDSDDMLETDGRCMIFTASTAGPKTIFVPEGMKLYREGNATPLEVKNGKYTESFELGEVRFYRLEK